MPKIHLSLSDTLIAWQNGILGYRLRETQKQILDAVTKAHERSLKYYIECTRRLGKSTFGLIWLTEDAIQNPGCVSAFFAPVKEGLKDYIQPIIRETFSDCPDELRPILDSSLTLTFPGDSKIIFRGSNNLQHRVRRGNAFRRVFVDEARDVDDLDNLVDSVVIPSLFSTKGRLLISSTPADTDDHPLYAIKQATEKEGCYFHCSIYDAAKYDPEDFPLERIETWKKETTDEVAWQREYLALWVKDPTKIIIPEWNESYVQAVPRDEFFQFYQKYAALDSGVTDKTAGLLGYYDFKKATLVIEDEFTLHESEVRTDRISILFKTKESELGYQTIHDKRSPAYRDLAPSQRMYKRVADNDNLILVNDLNSTYDLDFFATGKDQLAAMINAVREWVKDGRILVHPRCKELAGCLSNAVWDKNREKLAKSKIYGHFDALSALIYLVRNIDRSTNPIPQHFGRSWETHPGVPYNANAPQSTADRIAQVFIKQTDRQRAREDFVKGGSNGIY